MHDIHPDDCIFIQETGPTWRATELARGPWDSRAQHGGAPCGLLAHLVESAPSETGWQLARLTVELLRPVPIDRLETDVTLETGRASARVEITLRANGKRVARAHGLLVRAGTLALPSDLPRAAIDRLPPPEDCPRPLRIPGLPEVRSFYYTAMEGRVAGGDPAQPGPAAAWLRLKVPLVAGVATSAAMRIAAAADFGNGLSWVLPADRFAFANADLSLHLARPPSGEWIGLQASTSIVSSGCGQTITQLYDTQGPCGVAVQSLLIMPR